MSGTRLDERGVIVSCASCGRANRLLYSTLGKATRCGSCRTPIAGAAEPIEVERASAFDAAAAQSALPVIVDFWASWCGPCRAVAPQLERVATSSAGRFLVVKVNTDVHQEIGARFRVQSIPTLAVLHGGREIARLSGARSAEEILAFAERAVADAARKAS